MSKKVAVVTGSNKGIGYGIVKGLCEKFDGDVYLTARDEKRGLAAIKNLNDLGYQPKFHLLDVTVAESVRKLRDHIVEHYGGLDVLVNNAGIGDMNVVHLKSDERRAREIIRVNYFGFRDTCNILFPILKPHARVVNLTSLLGHLTWIRSQRLRTMFASPDLTEEKLNSLVTNYIKAVKNDTCTREGWPKVPYCISKVALSALSRIQQRKLLEDKDRPDIVVNHVNPGPVATDINVGLEEVVDIEAPPSRMLTIEEGAEAAVFLALLPENTTKPKGDLVWYTKEIVDWVNGPVPPEETL